MRNWTHSTPHRYTFSEFFSSLLEFSNCSELFLTEPCQLTGPKAERGVFLCPWDSKNLRLSRLNGER